MAAVHWVPLFFAEHFAKLALGLSLPPPALPPCLRHCFCVHCIAEVPLPCASTAALQVRQTLQGQQIPRNLVNDHPNPPVSL